MRNRLIASLSAGLALAGLACSDSTGVGDGGALTITFALATPQPNPSGVFAAPAALPLEGDNGTLTIDEIWLVVDELRLERVEDACEDDAAGEGSDDGDDDDCERFELAPFFVSLPLEGDGLGEVSAEVAPGSYEELKLETKAPDEGGTLLADIRQDHFDDWPGEASLLVIGTFTPTDGDPIPFRVFFDAEVKVELEFEDGEPLVVEEGGDLTVTVFVDPAAWFAEVNGTVTDLSAFDFDATDGEVFEFEAKFEDGFTKIEIDD